jgi:hypothetical protein
MEHLYKAQKKIELDGDGSITVTVSSSSPIDEADYMILRPDAAKNMAECLTDFANAMRPPGSPKIGENE